MYLSIYLGMISFYLLSDTANKYLSSALTTLAERLNISQNLAGVTFLAFGNGAPDIISSFVASENDQAGIDFSVGALVGSGVFITCFVVSSVVYYAKCVQVRKDMFSRDIIIYIITLILLLVFSIDGKISIYETICFFVVYLM
jgi:sodium/potassium/calcium exchanger 6